MPERVDHCPLLALFAQQVPDDRTRATILSDTPGREYGFARTGLSSRPSENTGNGLFGTD
jgi:hypothetical protein